MSNTHSKSVKTKPIFCSLYRQVHKVFNVMIRILFFFKSQIFSQTPPNSWRFAQMLIIWISFFCTQRNYNNGMTKSSGNVHLVLYLPHIKHESNCWLQIYENIEHNSIVMHLYCTDLPWLHCIFLHDVVNTF